MKTKKNLIVTLVHKLVVQVLNMCHIFISCIVIARRVAHKVQLHLDWYVWMNMYISTIDIHVAYIVSHVIECHVQLVFRKLHKFAIACVTCN